MLLAAATSCAITVLMQCGDVGSASALHRYKDAFKENDITDMSLLVEMVATKPREELRATLREVGVASLGHFEVFRTRLPRYYNAAAATAAAAAQ